MFGLSLTEIAVIVIVALLAIGPKDLPQAAAKIGRVLAELRKATDEIRREFYECVQKPLSGARAESGNAADFGSARGAEGAGREGGAEREGGDSSAAVDK